MRSRTQLEDLPDDALSLPTFGHHLTPELALKEAMQSLLFHKQCAFVV